ncbi:MAG: hypothetical protein D6698_16330 [Gammaproteobacteria bacterium]|nr:MAG: hypothetical protein D6698_16330 [Gammaproteobacteria bacterium]
MTKFRWTRRPSQAWNMGGYMVNLMDGVEQLLNYWAPQIERDMKMNAAWVDRTANARQTLAAFVIRLSPYQVALIARQYMHYGKFLELRHGGRYAIVMPTMRYYYAPIWSSVKELVE